MAMDMVMTMITVTVKDTITLMATMQIMESVMDIVITNMMCHTNTMAMTVPANR